MHYFAQFYEGINNDDLIVDVIDTFLMCVRLKLQRNEDEDAQMMSSRKFGLITIDIIRALVHVVRQMG